MSIPNNLVSQAAQNGLIPTIACHLGTHNLRIAIPYSNNFASVPVQDVDFSVRAMHALKRSGLDTIGLLIESIENNSLLKIRNLGKKTLNEIQTRVLIWYYQRLTDSEKAAFFDTLYRLNAY